MYIRNNVHLINMWKFYFEDVGTILRVVNWIKILEKELFNAKSEFKKKIW